MDILLLSLIYDSESHEKMMINAEKVQISL